jgi:transposase
MLSLSSRVRIFAASEVVDFRKGFDGLVQIVRDGFGLDPFGGDVFCFFNVRVRCSHLAGSMGLVHAS